MVETTVAEQVARSNEIAATIPKHKLNDGTHIPVFALGTFKMETGSIYEVVKTAILKEGYRHIDCAKVYENEEEVGRAINDCIAAGIKREDLYIVSKLWHTDKGRVAEAYDECLKRLNLEYLDLWILHWTTLPDVDWTEKKIRSPPLYLIWKEMEKLVKTGKCKSIGVSNATVHVLLDIIAGAEIKPVYNQIETHPYFNNHKLIGVQHEFDVYTAGYATIGSGVFSAGQPAGPLHDPTIAEIAAKHGKTAAQVIFAWHHHHRTIILCQTSKVERLSENLKIFDFTLSEDEIKTIDGLDKPDGRRFDSSKWGGSFHNIAWN